MFSGVIPFPDSTPTTVVAKVLSGERPERPKDRAVTQELWALTRRCLEENPERRPEIREVIYYLRKVLANRKDGLCGAKANVDDAVVGGAHPWRCSFVLPSRGGPKNTRSVPSQLSWPWELEKVNPQAVYKTHLISSLRSKESWQSLECRPSGNKRRMRNVPSGLSGLLRRALVWFLDRGKAQQARVGKGLHRGIRTDSNPFSSRLMWCWITILSAD